MTELEKWEAVNACENHEELSEIISKFADGDGRIKGKTRGFNAKKMSEFCLDFNNLPTPNLLTRNYGIRQQALYIQHYEALEIKIQIRPYLIDRKAAE